MGNEAKVENGIPLNEALQQLSDGRGFDHVGKMHGSSFERARTMIICPTRGGPQAKVHHRVFQSWMSLIAPPNQARGFEIIAGDEVGVAYNRAIEQILAHPEVRDWEYVMTVEDDNIIPPDAHIRLIESIKDTRADAVSAIYWTKGEIQMPMAYGDPAEFEQTKKLDMRPRTPAEVTHHLQRGRCMEVNGIAMGCALWRMELFKSVPPPWFVTVADVTPEGVQVYTQDLSFCRKARLLGKRFVVDFRVRVGHLDTTTGVIY